ncbi:MAG: DUF1329 domain-containing protein [Candidatus Binataceae bacterium]
MNRIVWLGTLAAVLMFGAPAFAQSDLPDMQQWLKDTANQGTLPPGTKITMANWQQYKQFMPLSMVALFQGTYTWKMPADVEMDVGETHHGLLPKTFLAATEQYGAQTKLVHLPNGHIAMQDYHGGVPFPNPQEPDQGTKLLVNLFYAYVPSIYLNATNNAGSLWFQDRFGNIAVQTLDVVYRQSGWNTDPGFPVDFDYAPGTWYTEWSMVETPEQSKYTALLSLFYKDEQAHPFPDTYVFVPALRRSLRLSVSARCAPVYGSDWTNDDAKTIGFNGGTSLFHGEMLGERKVLGLISYNQDYSKFPQNWDMPLGFPKPSWGQWEVRDTYVDDVRRVPSENAGYCYGSRMLYIDKEFFYSLWTDLYDSNVKLWKAQWWGPRIRPVPGVGPVITNSVGCVTWDLQNTHASIWSSAGNPTSTDPLFNQDAPAQYQDGVKYGSPAGLMMIMR